MKYSKTAIKELTARYSDVLKKCAFLNAVILMSVALAAPAGAYEIVEDNTNLNTIFPDGVITESGETAKGIDSTSENGYKSSLTTQVIDISATDGSKARGVDAWWGSNVTIGSAEDTESVSIYGTQRGLSIFDPDTVVNVNAKNEGGFVSISGDGVGAAINDRSTLNMAAGSILVTSGGDGISAWTGFDANDNYIANSGGKVNINTKDLTVNAGDEGTGIGANYSKSQVTVNATGDVDVTAGDRAIHVGNATTDVDISNKENTSFVTVAAQNINLTSDNIGVSAMSNGYVDLVGDTTITADKAILARGNAVVNINKDQSDKKTVLNGDIVFDFYGPANSNSLIDAYVNANLVGENSSWTGNSYADWNNMPDDPTKLDVTKFNVALKNGATWTATAVDRTKSEAATDGLRYQAVNNLDINDANVVIQDPNGVEVENLVASKANITGGTMTVTKTINTIDNVIDDYTNKILLGQNVAISGDLDFASGTADKYSAAAGTDTVVYKVANAMSVGVGGTKDIKVVDGAVTVNKDGDFAWFNSDVGLEVASSGNADGMIKVTGKAGGIDAAADASATAAETEYNQTANENLTADKTLKNNVILNGGGTESGDPSLNMTGDLTADTGATVEINEMKLTGTGKYVNNAGARTKVKNSRIDVDVNSAGTWESDPTTYSGTVTVSSTSSFDEDTFLGTAELANSGNAFLMRGTEFKTDATITGAGSTTLASGITHFNNTASSNLIKLAQGATFDGTLASTGTVDTRNGSIDAGLGTVTGGSVYVDADYVANAIDTFATGRAVDKINLINSEYGSADTVDLNLGGNTLATGATFSGGYFTKMKDNGDGTVTFSDKLLNTSGLYSKLGSWSGGNYILNNVDMDNPADSTHLTVGGALTALDTQVKTNADNIANLAIADKGNLVDGSNITAGTVTKAKLATAVQNTLDGAIQGVSINGTALTPDASQVVNIIADTTATDSSANLITSDAVYDATTMAGAGNNYAAGASVTTAVGKLDTTLGAPQTAAATKGILNGKIIGGTTGDSTVDIDVVTALDKVATTAVGSGADNEFTGKNTFKGATIFDNAGGISIKDGADTYATKLTADAYGLKVSNGVEATGLKLGTNDVTSIDIDGTSITSATTNAKVIETGYSVYKGAQNAEYANALPATSTNIATTTTLKAAIQTLDSVMGNIGNVPNTNGNVGGSTVAAKLNSIDTNMGNLSTLTTTQTSLVDAINEVDATIGGAIGATDGVLNGKVLSNGTGTNDITVAGALNLLNTAVKTNADDIDTLEGTMGSGTIASTGVLSGKVLSNGTGTNDITVTGALGLLNDAISSSDAKAASVASSIGGTWSGDTFTHATYNDKEYNIANTDSLTTAIGKLDIALNTTNTSLGTATASSATGILGGKTIGGTSGATSDISVINAINTIASDAAGKGLNNTYTGTNTFGTGDNKKVIISNDGALTANTSLKVGTDDNNMMTVNSAGVAIGKANAIKSTENATLNMGGNALTNVASLTTTGNATIGGTLTAGATTVASLAIAGGTYGIDASGAATLASVTADTVTATNGLIVGTAAAITGDSTTGLNMGGNKVSGISTLTTTSDAVIGGTLKVGAANAITGTATTLNMGANDVTGIKDLTTSGAATIGTNLSVGGTSTFTGAVTAKSGITSVGLTLSDGNTTTPTEVTMNVTGTPTSSILTVGAGETVFSGKVTTQNGFSVDNSGTETFAVATNGDVTAHALQFGAGQKVTTIDNSGASIANDTTYTQAVRQSTLATAETVYAGAQNAVYTNNVTTGSNIAAGATLGTAIKDLDETIGNMSTITNNAFGTTSGIANGDVATALNTLAGNVATGMGGGFDTAGVWSGTLTAPVAATPATSTTPATLATATDYGYTTPATSLLGAVQMVANNIGAAATGAKGNISGTAAVNANLDTLDLAIGDRAYVNNAAVDYNAIGAGTDLTVAVSQVASNVGAAATGANGNISGTATVNANLDALDAAIGGINALNTANGNLKPYDSTTGDGTVAKNLNALDATLGNVLALDGTTGTQTGNLAGAGSTVADHLTAIDNRMGQITGLYDGTTVHSTNVASTVNGNSNLAVGTTVEDHLVSLDNAIGDRTQLASSAYVNPAMSMADAVGSLDTNLNLTEQRVRRVEKEMRGGFASMAAMSALIPNARAAGDTQLSVGAGAYRDHQGLAIGAFHYFNDNVLANMGVSYGGDKSTVFRAGVTFGW